MCIHTYMHTYMHAENIDSTSLLLNGVAIAFVLLIDDELPAVLLSDDDQVKHLCIHMHTCTSICIHTYLPCSSPTTTR